MLFFMLIVCFSAENDTLRKTLAAKEEVANIIPRPEKGTAGNGFNLQEAMGLADDVETYSLLRVSFFQYAACTYLTHDCSALFETWQFKRGLIVLYCGTANPKKLLARLSERFVLQVLPFKSYISF